jgi:HK97 family phage major capsid protein
LIRSQVETFGRKAAVAAGSPTDPSWAAPLVPSELVAPLLLSIQQESVLGRLVGARRVPFNASVPNQTAAGSFGWVQAGAPKPAIRFAFDTLRLAIGKVSGIVVLTDELVRLSAPAGETAMRDALTAGLVAFQDLQLLDPAISEITNTRPASITHGVVPTVATGTVAEIVGAVLGALSTSRPGAARPTLIMAPAVAGQLGAVLRIDNGAPYYGVTPIVTTPAAAANVIALDAAAVVYADGGLAIDVSEQAAIETNDAPTAPTAATVMASFWELDLVGFRIDRQLWWTAAPGAVQYVADGATVTAARRSKA